MTRSMPTGIPELETKNHSKNKSDVKWRIRGGYREFCPQDSSVLAATRSSFRAHFLSYSKSKMFWNIEFKFF